MNKTDLIQKVKALEGLSQDERAYLINLVNTKKKYGLVWEDKPEEVEEQLRENLPVLREVIEKRILGSPLREKKSDNKNLFDKEAEQTNDIRNTPDLFPNHILIEGDNLHALTALSFTHEGQCDIIYIDPPYNTGNNDFIYNDKYIDSEDSFKHSKWLSFIHRRLKIGKLLLKPDGIIFISIGDNEQSQLKLLCDEIFGETNFITNAPRVAKKTSDKGTYFKPTKDYVLAYAKNISLVKGFGIPKIDDIKKYKFQDKYGKYKKSGAALYQPSLDSRPNQRYWIECPDGSFVIPPGNIFPEPIADASFIKPIDNKDKVWRWSYPTYLAQKDKLMFCKTKTSPLINEKGEKAIWNIYDKVYLDSLEGATNLPEDIIYDFKNSQGSKHLIDMGISFSFSKPYELIKYLIYITQKPNDICILDFFAGSGTTLEATMQLNNEDSGARRAILVTNNENGIAENITYKRNAFVINGYETIKGQVIDGLTNNNLRYFKSEFVSREPSLKNKRQLTQLATELLCIKEDCYTEQKINIKQARLFANSKVTLLILFDDHIIPQAVEFIKTLEAPEIKVYVFSIGSDPYTEDFAEVLDKVTLCALPDAIYKAYQNVLPKKNRVVPIIEEEVETPTNESGEQLFNI
jgi:adenine-specific DNA-methyltransferase